MRPKKALGQHFLVDRGVRDRILRAADLDPRDVVIEVGPGRGTLTKGLVATVARVVAIELDQELAAQLPQRLGHPPGLQVVVADAREADPQALLGERVPYKVLGNLPYYAANPIVRRFLEAAWKPTLMVVMVQKEVAQRMVAQPGDMSLLSVAVQFYGRPRMVCTVPARAFSPPPKVTSAVVRIDVLPRPALEVQDPDAFFHLVRAGFSAPRKQLGNALSIGLDIPPAAARSLLERASIDPSRRPETLALEEWGRLYRAYGEGQ